MVAVIIFLVAWVGIRGGMAAAAVADGAAAASKLSPLLVAQDGASARTETERVQRAAAEAHALTSDPVWRAIELVPYLGSNLTTVREGITSLDLVASGVLEPVTELATTVKVNSLRSLTSAERRSSLALAAPALEKIDRAMSAASTRVASVDVTHNVGPLAVGFKEIRGSLTHYAAAAAGLSDLTRLVPSLALAAPSAPWTIVITNLAADGTALPVALLTAVTSAEGFHVTGITGASADEGEVPDAAAAGTLTVDVAALELLTERLGGVSVPGVGDLTGEQVADFATTGAYTQAPSVIEAEQSIGAFAAAVIARLVD